MKKPTKGIARAKLLGARVVFTCTPAEKAQLVATASQNGRSESAEARYRCFIKNGGKK